MDDRETRDRALAICRRFILDFDERGAGLQTDIFNAVCTALADRLEEREGWVMAPREPTRKMLAAGLQELPFGPSSLDHARSAYAAMLSALPTPEDMD